MQSQLGFDVLLGMYLVTATARNLFQLSDHLIASLTTVGWGICQRTGRQDNDGHGGGTAQTGLSSAIATCDATHTRVDLDADDLPTVKHRPSTCLTHRPAASHETAIHHPTVIRFYTQFRKTNSLLLHQIPCCTLLPPTTAETLSTLYRQLTAGHMYDR